MGTLESSSLQATWLRGAYPGNPDQIWETTAGHLLTQFLSLLGPLVALLLLLRGPCLFNLLGKLVSPRQQHFHVKLIVMHRVQPILDKEDLGALTTL